MQTDSEPAELGPLAGCAQLLASTLIWIIRICVVLRSASLDQWLQGKPVTSPVARHSLQCSAIAVEFHDPSL